MGELDGSNHSWPYVQTVYHVASSGHNNSHAFHKQNTFTPSQDTQSLIQLWYQSRSPVSCDLHQVQLQVRLLVCRSS